MSMIITGNVQEEERRKPAHRPDRMPDLSEVVHYDDPQIPLYIHAGYISSFPGLRALPHWHEDLEWIHILTGSINYEINGDRITLLAGDSLFVNSKAMHFGFDHRMSECTFICVLFPPAFLSGQNGFYDHMVKPLLTCELLPFFHFSALDPSMKKEDRKRIGELLRGCLDAKNQRTAGYEFTAVAHLVEALGFVYRYRADTVRSSAPSAHDDKTLQQKMVSYIYEHFGEPVTLEQIAYSSGVSVSTCCRIFKKRLGQSPVDFLNVYRLEVAHYRLLHSDESVTDIALSCGFNHLSYFSSKFSKHYGLTPIEYRRKHSRT